MNYEVSFIRSSKNEKKCEKINEYSECPHHFDTDLTSSQTRSMPINPIRENKPLVEGTLDKRKKKLKMERQTKIKCFEQLTFLHI